MILNKIKNNKQINQKNLLKKCKFLIQNHQFESRQGSLQIIILYVALNFTRKTKSITNSLSLIQFRLLKSICLIQNHLIEFKIDKKKMVFKILTTSQN